jgi:hypothetical protein
MVSFHIICRKIFHHHQIYTDEEEQRLTQRTETHSIDGSTPTASSRDLSTQPNVDPEKGFIQPATAEQKQTPNDPNIVDWDGPDDPENPLNWTSKRKFGATMSIALITLLTYENFPQFYTILPSLT